jgi:hypothetical protein
LFRAIRPQFTGGQVQLELAEAHPPSGMRGGCHSFTPGVEEF